MRCIAACAGRDEATQRVWKRLKKWAFLSFLFPKAFLSFDFNLLFKAFFKGT